MKINLKFSCQLFLLLINLFLSFWFHTMKNLLSTARYYDYYQNFVSLGEVALS